MADDQKKMSRRDFVKNTGTALVGAGLSACATSSKGLLSAPKRISEQINKLKENRHTNQPIIIDVHRHSLLPPTSVVGGMMKKFIQYQVGMVEYEHATSITLDGITLMSYPELTDIDAQVKSQEEAAVTVSLLSASMFLETMCRKIIFMPDMKLHRRMNDYNAGLVAKYPKQLDFSVNVNPFDRDGIKECVRCINELGAKGISITTSWDGEFLDSPRLDPFWEYAQDKDETIILHPPLIPIGADKMDVYKLEEIVGRPFDTTMSVTRMIYAGVFDRYPKLKIVVPHMGGGLPNIIGRLEFGYRLGYKGFPEGQKAVCKHRPIDYLRTNLYVDTMGFSAYGIKHCIDLFGVDRVLFGTDYPAVPISQKEHVDIVRSLKLSQEDEEKIFWKNANTLFRLI